jgi:quercetin dioxygenase-like cupin family protein
MTRRQLGFVFTPVLALIVVAVIWFLYGHRAPPPQVEITAEPGHHLALENEYVRVFKVEVGPNASTLLHRHGYDYIYVTLGVSEVENDVAGKPPIKLTLQDGETHFVPGGFAHVAKNLSDQPFRNVTIELMQDEKARQSPPPQWGVNGEEERGLQVLNGGTGDILFVKDGVRVSQFDLQPGGVLPKHHHAGPHLLVAVTDLDLRSDIEGNAPAQIQLKAGDIAWTKGDSTHALTNIGKQNAKLITVEFQ